MNPSEEQIISNMKPETLYGGPQFKNGQGRYFNIVFDDAERTEAEAILSTRTKITLTYIKNSSDRIAEIKFKKFTKSGNTWTPQGQEITFSNFSIEKLAGFLDFFRTLDLDNIGWGRFRLASGSETGLAGLSTSQLQQLKTILQTDEGKNLIEELINSGLVTHKDIVSVGYRRKCLQKFREFLNNPTKVSEYGNENNLPIDKVEKIWQHFFNKNQWIFGYGLDYRFLGILQKEASTGESDTSGLDESITDFLLGCKDFTVLVELKKPKTDLFVESRTSAGVQRISNDLVRAVSQILGQKADWQIKSEHGRNFNSSGEPLRQKTVDPKALLIIGRSTEYRANDRDSQIKARTFEMFRRDSRSIEILTYDELYERAKFIVEGSPDD